LLEELLGVVILSNMSDHYDLVGENNDGELYPQGEVSPREERERERERQREARGKGSEGTEMLD